MGLKHVDNNYSLWRRREEKQEAWLERRPVCAFCMRPIQDEACYPIPGYDELIFCPDCMEFYIKRDTEDFCE